MSQSEGRALAPRSLALERNRLVLEPLDADRLIDEEHAARKIWRVVERLDLSRFEAEARAVEGSAGRPGHSPQALVAVWIYAYSRGLHAAREIARQSEHEPGLRWLTALRPINHHTLSDFRVAHGEALRELFVQVLAMLVKNRLVTLERIAADGTKIRADAARKSFSRAGAIRRHLQLAREHVEELERQERDEQTTKRERAARERAVREREERLAEALAEIERLRAEKKTERDQEPQASRTDPTARFMRTGDGGLAPGYNVQIAADAAHGLIADVEVSNEPQDAAPLPGIVERLRETFGRYPRQALADGGYTNQRTVAAMAERGIDDYGTMSGRAAGPTGVGTSRDRAYWANRFGYDEATNERVCPEGKRLRLRGERELADGRRILHWAAAGSDCGACAARAQCCPRLKAGPRGRTRSEQRASAAVEAFDRKMATAEGQAIYRERAPLVEFPNAWIKTKLGLRRFATRGLEKVRCEALWAALTFN